MNLYSCRLSFVCCVAAILSVLTMAWGQSEGLRVGVWNIEKLSTTATRGFPELTGNRALPPRSEEDLRKVADYLLNVVGADALMITEIDPDSGDSTDSLPQSEQLNQICGFMGSNWRYFLSRTGAEMRLGFLFNQERVALKKIVNLHAPEFPVAGKDVFDRDPFIVWIEPAAGGFDLLLACVHLKSQQQPFRDNRLAAMAKLVGDLNAPEIRRRIGLPSHGEEPEVFILGDCNDASFKNRGFKYMFDYLQGVGYRHMRPAEGDYPATRINGSQIDHIFASAAASGGLLEEGSFQVHGLENGEAADYRRHFSDHFPVTVDLSVQAQPHIAGVGREVLGADAETDDSAAVVDDQDEGDVKVEAEVIDRDFERILAPVRAEAGVAPMAKAAGGAVDGRIVPGDLPDGSGPRLATEVSRGRFAGDVVATWLDESEAPDRAMRLVRDFDFVDGAGFVWRAPAGWVIDGASIPPVFWNKFIGPPFVGDYRRASVVHDVACDQKARPHREVHRMFYDACLVGGVSEAKAKAMYWAVRTFGPRWSGGPGIAAKSAESRIGIEELGRAYEIECKLQYQPGLPIEELEALLDGALSDPPETVSGNR